MRHPAGHRQTRFERITRAVALLVLAPVLLALALTTAFHIARHAEYGLSVLDRRVVRVEVAGPAARAGVRVDDHVLAVDDRPVRRMEDYYAASAGHYRLEPLTFTLERAGAPLRFTIEPELPSQTAMITQYTQWVSGLAFLLIGWWVLTRRADPVARHFFAMCAIFAFFLCDIPDLDHLPYLAAKYHLRALLQFLLPAYVLRFFLQFPTPWRAGPRGGSPLRGLMVPAWLLFALSTANDHLRGDRPSGPIETIIGVVSLAYMLACFLFGLGRFARGAFRRDRPMQRTKMLVILGGLTAGLVPFLATMALGNLVPGARLPHLQYLGLSLLLVPASFALAIMRYGALDTAFVVRIGLIYGALTALVVVGYLLVTVAVGTFLSTRFAIDSSYVLVLLVAGTALVVAPLRLRVQRLIDLAFYPSRRANREAIARLADRLTGLIEADAVLDHLGRSLGELFRPRTFAIVLAAGGQQGGFRLRAAWPTPSPALTGFLLPADNALTAVLDRVRRPLYCEELDDPATDEAPGDSYRALLRGLGAALLVPLISGNRLLGFLVFGPKSGGQLYGQEDIANLQALAVQAGPVVESRQLYEERLRVKRLETELSVARGIQANLLPVAPLVTAFGTICGRNEPCRTVGGDYFDYFTMDGGQLALAIGDVSGKGIPAALMMSSLRVAFRLAAEAGASPREVVSRMNPVVASLVGPAQFICFFYAVWDPASGLLRYCNAGMDPPVLLRPGAPRQFLRKGGPVLGVEPAFVYREGTVALGPSDRLFLYTDGLTEQRDPEGRFFDAERLIALVEDDTDGEPLHVLDRIFATVRAFGHDRRSDDQTAMLLYVNALTNENQDRP